MADLASYRIELHDKINSDGHIVIGGIFDDAKAISIYFRAGELPQDQHVDKIKLYINDKHRRIKPKSQTEGQYFIWKFNLSEKINIRTLRFSYSGFPPLFKMKGHDGVTRNYLGHVIIDRKI